MFLEAVMTEEELLKLLANDEEFKRVIMIPPLEDVPDLEDIPRDAHRLEWEEFANHALALEDAEDPLKHATSAGRLKYRLEAFPEHEEKIKSKFMTLLLASSDDEFKNIISYDFDLRDIAKQYPDHADALIQRVLNSDVEFQRLMMYPAASLKGHLKAFPEHAEAIKLKFMALLLASDDEFKWFISNIVELCDVAKECPAYAHLLIRKVLRSDDEFKRLIIENVSYLENILATFKANEEEIKSRFMTLVLAFSDDEFRQIISPDNLRAVAKQCPAYANLLIQRVFKLDGEFERLMKYPVFLKDTLAAFPESVPDIKSKFISLLASDDKFIKIIGNFRNLCVVLEQLPDHADALIQRVLSDPVFFDCLIGNDVGLEEIKPFCQNFSLIRDANSFQALRDVLKGKMIETNRQAVEFKMQLLRQSGFFRGSELCNVGPHPDELRTKELPGGGFSRLIEDFLISPLKK